MSRFPARLLLGAASLLAGLPSSASAAAPATREILTVSNNWAGTADLIDTTTYRRLARLDIAPDRAARIAELRRDPSAYGVFLGIRELIGEGHDQLVDDGFTSPDGRFLYVSRPSFHDVVALSLRTRRIVWRFVVEGSRSDHMALSPDGRRLLVSASTARKVQVIDTRTGRQAASFPSGDQPHESNFSRDGKRVFHASIGTVFTEGDSPEEDAGKGERVFEIVDARTWKVISRVDIGDKLRAAGFTGLSSAIRPMAIAPGERYAYFQLSFLHGFVEYDMRTQKVLRVARLPVSAKAKALDRKDYLLDSAHHGLTMNGTGTRLCAAGTMSDYAAIVDRDDFATKTIAVGRTPYWATSSSDGRRCFVSVAGDDRVSVIDYATRREVRRIAVGDHPQRMRIGRIRSAYLP